MKDILLFIGMYRNHEEIVTSYYYCLQSGCGLDIDARDYFDNTPLHIASEVSFKRIKSLVRPIIFLIDQYIIHVHVKVERLRAFSNLLFYYSNHETNLLYLEK